MRLIAGQVATLTTLGALAILTGGAVAWSLATSPNVADVRVETVAANTAAASSFVETMTLTLNSGDGGASQGFGSSLRLRTVAIFDYNATDRVEMTTGPSAPVSNEYVKATQIGLSCWVSVSATQGSKARSNRQGRCPAKLTTEVLQPLLELEDVKGVEVRGGAYQLTGKDLEYMGREPELKAVSQLFTGLRLSAIVEVEAQGTMVSSIDVSLESSGSTRSVDATGSVDIGLTVQFTDIGTAPVVRRPAGHFASTTTIAP